ncbi:MAG: hypothetical protein ACP5QR_01540 [Rhizomicrobium sp.]
MTDEESDARSTTKATDAEEMERYGIVLIPVDYFHFGNFRYTRLKDAVAQAKRGTPAR